MIKNPQRIPFVFAGLLQAKALGLQVFHGGTALKDGRVVTSGGRVLSVTAVKEDLMEALGEANRGVATIHFQGATFRRDIGHRGLRLLQQPLYVSTGPGTGPAQVFLPAPHIWAISDGPCRKGHCCCQRILPSPQGPGVQGQTRGSCYQGRFESSATSISCERHQGR